MIKRIIIEGPDCSGKSTVVDRVKNELRWDSKSLHHREVYQFYRYLKEYSSANQIVFDRSHFSEILAMAFKSSLLQRSDWFQGKIADFE